MTDSAFSNFAATTNEKQMVNMRQDKIFNGSGECEDYAEKRQRFAINLRQSKKKEILAERRSKLISKMKSQTMQSSDRTAD